jgi:hypothetical protein
MSHINRNFILAYIFLVGLPVVGLVGVLKSGRTLVAPVSIDGVWQVQADPVALATLPCGRTLALDPEKLLTISQSGKTFTLSFSNDTKSISSGVIDGTMLTSSIILSSAWAAEKGCSDRRELALLATVDPKAEPRSLQGKMSVSNCSSCVPVEFRAVRQTPAVKTVRGGSH